MTKHTPVPWTDELTPLVQPGDPRLSLNGRSPRVPCRLLAEDNFQFAKHRVNCHDELCRVLKNLADEAFKNMTGGAGHLIAEAYVALSKATGKPEGPQ